METCWLTRREREEGEEEEEEEEEREDRSVMDDDGPGPAHSPGPANTSQLGWSGLVRGKEGSTKSESCLEPALAQTEQ